MDYQVLRFFESIRNPALSGIFYFATIFLGGTISVFIALYLYWCYSKKYGIQLCLNMAVSGTIVQILKVLFRIERPWIVYPDLHPIKNALINATGYSFPSAHCQQATALFITLAFIFTGKNAPKKLAKHKKLIRILCAISIIIVGLSRIYFGVHTPSDVLTGIGVSLVTCTILNIIYNKYLVDNTVASITIVELGSLIGVAVTYIVFFNNSISYLYVNDTLKLCGAFFGFALGYGIQEKHSNFSTKGTILQYILKMIVGIGLFLSIEKGLKVALGENFFFDFTRYLVSIMFLASFYPYWFNKITDRKHDPLKES